jgi:hypothetical protein
LRFNSTSIATAASSLDVSSDSNFSRCSIASFFCAAESSLHAWCRTVFDLSRSAKLEKVKSHIQSAGNVKISWIGVEPEALRNCVEEAMIRKHSESNWNRENA